MKLNINLSFCSTEERQSLQDWNNMREGKLHFIIIIIIGQTISIKLQSICYLDGLL